MGGEVAEAGYLPEVRLGHVLVVFDGSNAVRKGALAAVVNVQDRPS